MQSCREEVIFHLSLSNCEPETAKLPAKKSPKPKYERGRGADFGIGNVQREETKEEVFPHDLANYPNGQ